MGLAVAGTTADGSHDPSSVGDSCGSPGAGFGGALGIEGSAGPVVPSIGGAPAGISTIGGISDEAAAVGSGSDSLGMSAPVSVDAAMPVSPEMSGDGAEGAGSMMIDGPEGSGSFEAMAGDASAVTVIGLNPTRLSPAPPTMAAAASNRVVLIADPCLGDRRVRWMTSRPLTRSRFPIPPATLWQNGFHQHHVVVVPL